ncbi:MAG: ATP-binding cassette domain-containing protein [candidate division Zixibacteria bacterium]|nr:ATP-binding cassette domain-containing protein [candidate division Zixibacteria bacterium]
MSGTAVQIEHLTRKFGQFTAVDDLSLTVNEGEIFGFLGANGAGKTTAIRMLCGLLLPTSGTGHVGGANILTESEKIKKSIGYMSQKFSLYRDLTGRENIQFYGSAYDLDKRTITDRMAELTDRLALGEFIDRISGSLPTGWRQRLALAVAIIHRPKIVFLDEPTGGVDPVFRRTFWSLLYEMADEGVTIFVTTHYMDEAEYCGRISIMHAGKLVEIGTPTELVAKYGAANLEDMFIDLISPTGVIGA